MTINYICKFCGTPGTATGDDECPIRNIEAWQSVLCCDRCGDFQSWYRKMIYKVRAVAWDWAIKIPRIKEGSRSECEAALTTLTQLIARMVCKFYRVGYIWDRDFVAQLMEMPDKAEFIVRAYENIVRREATARRAAPADCET